MDDYWYELGQDIKHDGKSLTEALKDCETSSERNKLIKGYCHDYED